MRRWPVRRDRLVRVLPWLWLAWVIVLLVLLWMVTATTSATSGTPPAAAGSEGVHVHSAVMRLGFFVAERGADGHGSLHGRDIVDGVLRLSAALRDVAGHESVEGSRVRDEIEEVGAAAALLRDDRLRDRHAMIARNAFTRAAGVISAIQSSRYPHLDRATAEAREAALRIHPDRPLLAQTEAVQIFFERSYDVLRAMSG